MGKLARNGLNQRLRDSEYCISHVWLNSDKKLDHIRWFQHKYLYSNLKGSSISERRLRDVSNII